MTSVRWVTGAIVALLLVPTAAAAQLQLGTVQGTVVSPDGTPADGVEVVLLDGLGRPLARTRTRDGRFDLTRIAPGSYTLRAEAAPLSAVQPLTIRDALAVDVALRLAPSIATELIVRGGDDGAPAPVHGVTLSGDTLRQAPVRLRSRAVQDAIATAPGWATEDNGLLHVRGVDDGFLYVIDGVPVYERLDGLFGQAPDPATIESINVLTGYIPPEFGFKSGGVIEVRSAARASDAWSGGTEVAVGSDRMRDGSVVAGGPLTSSTALTLGGSAQGSDRFLDPVHPENLHNRGASLNGSAQFTWNPSAVSLMSVVAGASRSRFDVPHGEEQEEAGQDQRQHLGNAWQSASWQRSWSPATVSQVAGYHRSGAATLFGSDDDTPLFTDAHRELRRAGVLASVTHQRGRQLFKVGGEAAWLTLDERFTFAVTDADGAEEAEISEGAAAFTPAAPFQFDGHARPTLFSVYAQDSIRVSPRFTLDAGLRVDRSRLLVAATQWSPRVGAAYQWPDSGTTLRASVGRFFQPPQPENLLLSSSPEARALSPFADEEAGGGADVEPERQTAVDLSISQELRPFGSALGGPLRLDVSYWRRWIDDAADPNVFFGTTIIFPNSVARGRAAGVELRVEVPRRRGWSAYGSYAHTRVTQYGPITGGLFLEEEVFEIGDGTPFTPDHDQRHVSAFGLAHEIVRTGTSWSVNGRYESGTPLEVDDDELDELADRPGVELVDLESGRVRPRTVFDAALTQRLRRGDRMDVDVRVALLNLTGERWAFNFSNPFSGTHFGPGRTLQVGVRTSFR